MYQFPQHHVAMVAVFVVGQFVSVLTFSLKNIRSASHCLLCSKMCGRHARIWSTACSGFQRFFYKRFEIQFKYTSSTE